MKDTVLDNGEIEVRLVKHAARMQHAMALPGNLFMDAPPHETLEELVQMAANRRLWKLYWEDKTAYDEFDPAEEQTQTPTTTTTTPTTTNTTTNNNVTTPNATSPSTSNTTTTTTTTYNNNNTSNATSSTTTTITHTVSSNSNSSYDTTYRGCNQSVAARTSTRPAHLTTISAQTTITVSTTQ